MNNVLEVHELEKNYTDFKLHNINFSLPMGYIMGLIGPNGSGKTTTIKSILNMVAPESGTITVFGKNNKLSELEIKKRIGVVFDSNYFVDDWNMGDVERAYSLFYTGWDSKKYNSLLSKFKIAREKRVKELSKGMQMKLMLACSFSYNAELLILDEPTSGLDPVSRDELLEILSDYIEDGKHSVIFSTHITSDLEKIADYITYINLGKMVYTGSKEEFVEGYRIVSGDKNKIDKKIKNKFIGLRTFTTGYEALIRKEYQSYACEAEFSNPTIDDIIVFMGRQTQMEKEGHTL